MTTVVPAATADLGPIESLLVSAGLPLDGLGEVSTAWFVARSEGGPVGAVAVERHEDAGLLRSLVVDPDWRSRGIGSSLVAAAEAHGSTTGMTALYLLTDSAEGFFGRRGWRRIPRDAAPVAIMASVEWAIACGESAVPMTRP